MDNFHISATGHSVNYFPEYLAHELGYFSDVNLKVTDDVPNPWTHVLEDINKGHSQAALGGIWVPSMYRSRVRNYLTFAELSNRCPLSLVSRSPVETFDWELLKNKVILVPGGTGASPYLYLASLLKKADFNLSQATFIHDLPGPMLAELFAGGMGDMFLADPLTAASLEHDNKAYHIASLAEVGEPIPWSVYYTVPELLDREDNLCGRFTLAIQRATTWIREHDAKDARDVISKFWPNYDTDIIVEIINGFRHHGMWSETVQVKEDELAPWQQTIAVAGLVDKPLSCKDLCDMRPFEFASAAIR